MDSSVKTKLRRNLFIKAWERCKSLTKSKSWHCTTTRTRSASSTGEEDSKKRNRKVKVAPQGCFPVYVGQEKQRFVIKTEFASHPLFKMLLEDAELEYGFNSQGPLLLPCDVDLFYEVLAEMESGEEISTAPSWSNSLSILCSPSCYFNNKRYGMYKLLSPSTMLKLNRT